MPTYEYQCTQCKETFDIFQGIKDEPKTECEKCGGRLEKLLSAGTGLIFKGSGFYITDYKSKPGQPAEGKSETTSKSAPKTEAPSKDTSPSKPATDAKS